MPRRPSSDSISMGSFVNLKVTAEKLVKEQASVKTDLDMANSKLKNSLEHINALQEKLQTAINENAMLKVKQKEDAKIWNGLVSKFSSTKALYDQLTETLHYLADQVCCAERDKKSFEDKFGASSSVFDGLNLQLTDLSGKLTSTEETTRKCEQELKELRLEKEEKENIYMDENSRITNRITEKGNVVQLYSTFDSWYKLVQQEKNLISKRVECQFDELHDWSLHITSENSAVRSDNEDLKNEVSKLQKLQEELMVQHAEECRLGDEKARTLESEAQTLVSEKEQLEMSMIKRQEIEHLSDTSIFSENKMKDLLVKFSTVEPENQDIQEKLHATLLGKESEVEILQKEISLHGQHADSLEKQLSKLCESEKEQLLLQLKENQLEDQRKEIQASLAAAETTLAETKKQYDLMLESKQSELTKHLKEISQRNDQAINDIRRKFELEKLEIVNLEKEKAEKLVGDLERKGEQKLAESKEESRQYLMRVQQEHASLVSHVQQEHDKKVSDLKAVHSEEVKYIRRQAEDELKEKTISLKKEHEVQLRAVRCEHDEECQKLQEELELQKSKEERQRALLQLQWKVMDGNQQQDQEVNSKKEYSVSSKMRVTDVKNRSQPVPLRTEKEGRLSKQTDSPFLGVSQTPVSNILKTVEKANNGNLMNIPKHSRKVTHREYEVETSNGKTVTKRKKTKSTVMFEDPTKHKRMVTPRTRANKDSVKVITGGANPRPSNIGDLFSEGSLNPYADDPYAFD